MKFTAVDLYRIGDGSGPGLHRVRRGLDVVVTMVRGREFVRGSPNGGASTVSAPGFLRRASSRWWRLPANSGYPDELLLRRDHGSHWLWEAVTDMPLDAYIALLAGMNAYFV